MRAQVHQINAFVGDNPEDGNPAGVVLDAERLSEGQMQFIAHEVGASETAFVLPDSNADYKLRFFTPTVEVPLCGHATIAAWSLMQQQRLVKSGEYCQNSNDELIKIRIEDPGVIYMQQPKQPLKEEVDKAEINQVLHISNNAYDPRFKPRVVLRQLMVGVASEEELDNLNPDLEAVSILSEEHDFFGIHVFFLSPRPTILATVRNFCPRVGIPEDAATGTGNGSFLEYLRVNHQLPYQDQYIIEKAELWEDLRCYTGNLLMAKYGLVVRQP